MQIIYIEDNKDFYQNISKYKDKEDKVYLKYKKQIINVSQLEKSHKDEIINLLIKSK